MRKILLFAWITILISSALYTGYFFYYRYIFLKERTEKIEAQFVECCEHISKELERGSQIQESLVHEFISSPSEKSLQKSLESYPELEGIKYFKPNETRATFFVSKKINYQFPENKTFIGKSGWTSAVKSRDGVRLLGFYSSEIHDPSSGRLMGYLIGVYRLPKTLSCISQLTLSYTSFPEIINAQEDILVHPYFFSVNVKKGHEIPPLVQDLEYSFPNSNGWKIIYGFKDVSFLYLDRTNLLLCLNMLLLWCATALLTLAVFLKAYEGKAVTLGVLSCSYTVICLFLMGFIIYQYEEKSALKDHKVEGFKDIFNKLNSLGDDFIVVPTMIHIESLIFTSNTTYLISGFITQVYPKDVQLDVGFIFPKAILSEESTVIDQLAVYEDGPERIYVYQFTLNLTKNFPPTLFPFDRRFVELQLWPKDIHHKIFFIPDFYAYKETLNTALRSIDKSVSVIDWTLRESFYGIAERPPYYFDSNTINYTIDLKIALTRSLNSSSMVFITLIICIIITFTIALIPIKKLNDPTLGMISIVVGILFVVTMNQADLRRTLEMHDFAYIDVCFFVYYTQLILFTINLIVYSLRDKPFLIIGYRNNLVPKLMYWPVLATAFTMIFWLALV